MPPTGSFTRKGTDDERYSGTGDRLEKQGMGLVTIAVLLMLSAAVIVAVLSGVRIVPGGDPEPGTRRILALAHKAVRTFEAVHGRRPPAVEHPLAASAWIPGGERTASGGRPHPFGEVLRARFVRAGSHGFPRGATVAIRGRAVVAGDPGSVPPAERERLLLPDDIFVGYHTRGDVPHLYGLSRAHLRILGASVDWITAPGAGPVLAPRGPGAVRGRAPGGGGATTTEPPAPAGREPADASGGAAPPAGDPAEAEGEMDRAPGTPAPVGDTLEALTDAALRTALATCQAELEALGALAVSPAPDRKVWLAAPPLPGGMSPRWLDVKAPVTGAYDEAHRVWIDADEEGGWQAGMLRIGEAWRRYRIRGTSLVDSYGTEILYVPDAAGEPALLSAGLDRCFVIHPGDNGVIDTRIEEWDGTPAGLAGDDRDAREDNVSVAGP